MAEDAALLAHHGPGTERARLTDGPNLELVRTLDVRADGVVAARLGLEMGLRHAAGTQNEVTA